MAWITVTEDDVKTRLAGAEVTALKSAALASGQSDPLPEIISQCVDEVRGYIAACDENELEEGEKIPQKLLAATLALIRYRMATRIPGRLLNEERKQEYTDAIRLLERVSECKFAIEEPETVEDETTATPTPSISGNTRRFTRETQDGI